MRTRMSRGLRVAGAVSALVIAVALAGCSALSPTSPPVADPTTPDAPSPTPTPTRVGVDDIDLSNGGWLYSPGGFSAPITIDFVDGAAQVDGVGYAMKEPVYADANRDGLEDALVPIERSDGNGWESLWYIFVADGESAVQVPMPVARSSRCGDAVTGVSATPDGFALEVILRMSPLDDAVPCSDPGTGVQRRVVGIEHDSAGDLWPVQTEPVAAWGGLCPGSEWMDAPPEKVALYTVPDTSGTVVNPATEPTAVFPVRAAPWEQLPAAAGVTEDDWAFVGSIPDGLPDAEAVRLHCSWAPRR
nr:hypothetical protein [Microbacterium bovistercoris]